MSGEREREIRSATRGVIWRYDVEDACEIRLPADARILDVGWESPKIRIWVLVDPELPRSLPSRPPENRIPYQLTAETARRLSPQFG